MAHFLEKFSDPLQPVLTVDDLASILYRASAPHPPDSNELVPLQEIERRAVLHALRETGGDKLAVAVLGRPRSQTQGLRRAS
jgi:hypothetical protein